MLVEKICNIFTKQDIHCSKAFEYLLKGNQSFLRRNAFLKQIQSMGLGVGQRDYELLWDFLDEKKTGQLAEDQFTKQVQMVNNQQKQLPG